MNPSALRRLPEELSQALEALGGGASDQALKAVTDSMVATLYPGRAALSPHLLYQAVDQAPVAVSITDPDAEILYVNDAFTAVTGYGYDEVVGKNESALSDESTPRAKYHELWDAILQGKVWAGELVNRRKDGSRYVAALTIAPVLDERNEITHFLGMHRDVTEARRLERQLENHIALTESVIESAPVVIGLMDESGRIVRGNRAYQQLKGELAVEPASAILEKVGSAFGGEDFSGREVRLTVRGGRQRWFSCSGVGFKEADTAVENYFAPTEQRYLLLVAEEITIQKSREEELRTAALRTLTAEQELTQGLREILGGATHQLEGPLNLLSASIGMVARRLHNWEGSDHVLDVLREAEEEGRRALTRLRNSMPMQQVEPFTLASTNQLLREVLALLTERMLGEGITVFWEPGEIPSMPLREGRIRGLFKQLVENALDALDAVEGSRELRVISRREGEEIVVEICDNGPGVPEGLRLKIFEPFFTTKSPAGRRAGMGLAMAQEVVNEHAGTLELDRHRARGSCFRVRLPLDHEPGEELG